MESIIRPRIIPVLLMKEGGLYKTEKFSKPRYVGDPRNAVKIFNEKQCDELSLLDISPNVKLNGPDFESIEEIVSEAFMPVAYGGGITNISQVDRLFSIGVEKVVVNTAAFQCPELISQIANKYGEQSVVLSVDIKLHRRFMRASEYRIFINNGKTMVNGPFLDLIQKTCSYGVGELLITSIDKDGTMEGMDVSLLKLISSSLTIPVIGCGGLSSLDDIVKIITSTDVSAVAAGSFFVFYGKHRAVLITYPNREDFVTISDAMRDKIIT